MAALIEARDISKVYQPHRAEEVRALRGISLTIEPGEALAVVGPSGSGKTSLLSLIGCMARPTSGRIYLTGQDVSRLPERHLAHIRRERYGFVFQQLNLLRDVSALDNVLLPLYPSDLGIVQMRQRAQAVLGFLELTEKERVKVRHLSGGEQQRVAIARALINRPQIIVADEPTAHLDSRLTAELLDILVRLKEEGKTIVLATHDPGVYRHRLVDRCLTLVDGAQWGDMVPCSQRPGGRAVGDRKP